MHSALLFGSTLQVLQPIDVHSLRKHLPHVLPWTIMYLSINTKCAKRAMSIRAPQVVVEASALHFPLAVEGGVESTATAQTPAIGKHMHQVEVPKLRLCRTSIESSSSKPRPKTTRQSCNRNRDLSRSSLVETYS